LAAVEQEVGSSTVEAGATDPSLASSVIGSIGTLKRERTIGAVYRAVAIALRESLIALAAARLAGEGQQTKMELVYSYLTGPRFRHRIEALVERFSDMQADLDRERKTMMRLWAKREEQIRAVVESTAGLYGDLQGIAGRSLLEIDGLELPLLDGPAADAAE
jgi:hypothetical protein